MFGVTLFLLFPFMSTSDNYFNFTELDMLRTEITRKRTLGQVAPKMDLREFIPGAEWIPLLPKPWKGIRGQ